MYENNDIEEKEPFIPCEMDLLVSLDLASSLRKRLDKLVSKKYTFVDVLDNTEKKPPIQLREIDHSVSFCFYPVGTQLQSSLHSGTKAVWKPKPKFHEDITYEDMCSVVVSSEWVLQKQGVYGRGREKRSELITGAVHSPILRGLKEN